MPTFEGTAACEILQQNLAARLVSIANHAEMQQEAAEGVLLVLHRLLFRHGAFLLLRHFAELTDEIRVGTHRIFGNLPVKPCELDSFFGQSVRRFLDVERLLNQAAFAGKERVQILPSRFDEEAAWNTDDKPVLVTLPLLPLPQPQPPSLPRTLLLWLSPSPSVASREHLPPQRNPLPEVSCARARLPLHPHRRQSRGIRLA